MNPNRPPIPGPEPNLALLVQTLDKYQCQYVLVGGMGSIVHGASNTTRDCDIVILQDVDNLISLGQVLRELNARDRSTTISAEEAKATEAAQRSGPNDHPATVQGFVNVQTDAGPLDILPDMLTTGGQRLTYRALDRDAVYIDLHDLNITVKVASIDHLIASKTEVGRPHDIETVQDLRRIQRESRPTRQPPTEPDFGLD